MRREIQPPAGNVGKNQAFSSGICLGWHSPSPQNREFHPTCTLTHCIAGVRREGRPVSSEPGGFSSSARATKACFVLAATSCSWCSTCEYAVTNQRRSARTAIGTIMMDQDSVGRGEHLNDAGCGMRCSLQASCYPSLRLVWNRTKCRFAFAIGSSHTRVTKP
jgi:hypothetical protein